MKKIILFMTLLLAISMVSAQPSLQPPHLFYGNVVVNGQSASDGVLVTAKIGNSDVGFDTIEDGFYTIVVQDPYGDRVGEEVKFFIGGKYTEESGIFSNEISAKTNVDLDIDGELYCGDYICSDSESCSSCSEDCSECESSSSSSGGGGGGGSGGPSIVVQYTDCEPDWECTDWLDCTTGIQKRACIDANKCEEDTSMPETERECEIPKELKSEDNEFQNEPFDDKNVDLLEDEKPKGLAAITGAVINSGSVSVISIVVVLVLIALFLVFRKRN